MKKHSDIDFAYLARICEHTYSMEELRAKLARRRPLRIKYGVDVTAPFLHIGHAVNLWLMRHFQERGHKVIFLIGDFTTQIGDPTDKSEARKVIKSKEIEKNAKDFIKQVSKVLITDKRVFEIRRNSEWYKKMNVGEFVSLLAAVTHAKLIQRDMFQRRIENSKEIYMHEMIYPILQGYDSVMLKSDLTIVGTDQLFNELMGRFYQEKFKQSPQVVMTTKITPGLDGVEKQSKSLGNYIALHDAPHDKFGKVMSLPDELIVSYLEIYTDIPLIEVQSIKERMQRGNLHPMEAKKKLATALVTRYHGVKKAAEVENEFVQVFQKKGVPRNTEEYMLQGDISVLDLVMATGKVQTRSEAKRLIEHAAVTIDDMVYTRWGDILLLSRIKDGAILRIGKTRFIRIKKRK